MRTTKGKWYAGWERPFDPQDRHEEHFDHFVAAQRWMVAELSWSATEIVDDGTLGDDMLYAAQRLNDWHPKNENRQPWAWGGGQYRYFIEWEPYPMSVTESKLA